MQVLYIPSKNHFQNESEHFLSKLSEHSEVIYIYIYTLRIYDIKEKYKRDLKLPKQNT